MMYSLVEYHLVVIGVPHWPSVFSFDKAHKLAPCFWTAELYDQFPVLHNESGAYPATESSNLSDIITRRRIYEIIFLK